MKKNNRLGPFDKRDSIDQLFQADPSIEANSYQPDSSQKKNIDYWAGNEYKKFLKILRRKESPTGIKDNSEEKDLFVSENIWYWAKEESRNKKNYKKFMSP